MKVVAITLPPTAKPDLIAESFTPPACVKVGRSETYTYKINNVGASTNQSFKVKVTADGTEIATHTYPSGIATNQSADGTFLYTFSTATTKSFTINVDSDNSIAEDNKSNNVLIVPVTAKSSCPGDGGGGDPDPTVSISGDFTIRKPTVVWGTGNFIEPQDITVTGNCAYAAHTFKYAQGTNGYTTDNLTPKDKDDAFAYDPGLRGYDGGIKLGTVSVTMTIKTTCGQFSTIGPKTFEVIPDPNKRPPVIEIKWFRSGESTPVTSVTQDEFVELRVTQESSPDGDRTTRLWDFSKDTWTSSLPSTYRWSTPYDSVRYTGIKATVEGAHIVCATAYDMSGTPSTPSCTTLFVEGKSPIPVIKGGTVVKEGRKLNPPLDSNDSYTKVPGRTIDHSRDEWTNWYGPNQVFVTEGTILVQLHVYDNTGLKSERPAYHEITVVPDLPPVINFEYTATMTRMERQFRNTSYSPDGDPIEQYRVTYGYDWYNNGACNPLEATLSNNNNYFAFRPDRVGNYCFRVYAKEAVVEGAGGKDAFKDYMVNVINDGPTAEFTATGTSTEPLPVNVTPYKATNLAGWPTSSLDTSSMINGWSANSDGLLISPRRESIFGRTTGSNSSFDFISRFSLPLGTANYGLSKQDIVLSVNDYNEPFSQAYPLGNGRMIVRNTVTGQGASGRYYLTGVSQSPVLLTCGTNNMCTDMAIRKELDEVIIAYINDGSLSGVMRHSNYWTRYKLSDLSNGVISSQGNSNFIANESLTAGYASSGTPATFSNGERMIGNYEGGYSGRVGGFSRLKFNSDYKMINLTTRTISSFKYGSATAYKTDTYTSLPALTPKRSTLWPYRTLGQLDEILYPMQDTTDKSQPKGVSDAKGNYYSVVIMSDMTNRYLVRWDGNTGMPTELKRTTDLITLKGVSGDGKYVYLVSGVYDYDIYDYVYSDHYINTSNGADTTSKPWDYTDYLPQLNNWINTYQNGFGDTYTGSNPNNAALIDRGSGVMMSESTNITDSSATGSAGTFNAFMSDTQYIGRPVGKMLPLYTYVPFTGQSLYSNEAFTFGQLINPASQRVVNGTVAWSVLQHGLTTSNIHAGMSFRIQDYRNMYRLESHYNLLRLVKIVNGRKTVLHQVNRIVLSDQWISYSVKLTGSRIRVYEGGGLIMELNDGTFTQGTMGPYSVSDNAAFKGITYTWNDADLSFATPGVAIVDTDVAYDVNYSDPEHDPKLDSSTQWQYAHVDTTKFLDARDGKSGLSGHHGRTVTSPILTFDKVGVYKIDYRVADDPHPDHRLAWGDGMFAAYSKYSDWYTQYLIVHRRPIANFTLGLDGGGSVTWTDYSYDPDRCYNVGSCQSGYETTHGILKKKFYYITPSGDRVDAKLVKPREAGMYTVAMAVADEYNAWSDWYEQTIDIANPVAPNNPPTVALTFPNGTQAAPSYVSLQPTITWNQYDPDPGTIFSTFDLDIKDEWGGCVECIRNIVMDTRANSWAWTMDNLLQMGRKYSAQVRVSDGESWSAWSNIGWMATNSPPSAYMTFPYGTQAAPNIINTLRPLLTWSQTDPDPGAVFHYFQIQITNEANNVTILDSGKVWQGTTSTSGSWTVPIDLPTGQKMRVRVKVWDEYGAESNWSPQTWFLINRPPHADFDWTPKPAFEGDEVRLLNRSSDPDGDPLFYEWIITGPAYSAAHTSVDAAIPAAVTDFHPGDYTVTLKATDIHGASDTITKIVRVGDLAIEGFVRHTQQWEENRKSYNMQKSGDPERPRPVSMFWSGEAFVLEAITNEPAAKVSARMSYTELSSELTSANRRAWKTQLQRDDFESLPDQAYTFQFTAVWPNGHTESASCIITVKNAWTEYTSSVRKE
ncbi:CARDB domain-containing protein [Paenibacillus piri]|nr:CARDB domain-containing protein [Paenibacillus piri]